MLHYHVDSDAVLHSSRYDDICIPLILLQQAEHGSGFTTCIFPLWLNIAFEIGLNVRDPLLDAAFYVPTPFFHVASNLLYLSISHVASKYVHIHATARVPTSSCKAKVGIGLRKDFHI